MDNKVDPTPLTCQAAEPAADRLHRLELAVQCADEGLTRWQAECFAQVSNLPLAGAEITLLLLIGNGGQSKTIKELARSTNRVDIPNIQYSLRKLAAAGLTRKQGAGRSGVTYSLTDDGCRVAERMQAKRERLLERVLAGRPGLAGQLDSAADALEQLSELYESALREADTQRQL
ncbi:winged helix DNA-binding protein [Leisingera thetidis]|uniref:winged helix DNA-binding protein n=1 Tax=Leisingera thetidis TaxID=2930199 RepID=UPI0021F7375F|nr:winged helix DNA-binding protein [Leisingera thetidis]